MRISKWLSQLGYHQADKTALSSEKQARPQAAEYINTECMHRGPPRSQSTLWYNKSKSKSTIEKESFLQLFDWDGGAWQSKNLQVLQKKSRSDDLQTKFSHKTAPTVTEFNNGSNGKTKRWKKCSRRNHRGASTGREQNWSWNHLNFAGLQYITECPRQRAPLSIDVKCPDEHRNERENC